MADARLAQHVEKGNADGLLISCVASCSNLWALIMDAGTGFTSQVYQLSPFFLHKVNFFVAYLFFLGLSSWISEFNPVSSVIDAPTGMDYGTVGEELLHQFYCWC